MLITLDGEELYLKPSLHACMQISRMDDAPVVTVEKIARLNFDTIVKVIALGLGVSPTERLQQRVFDTGVAKFTGPCIRFINNVNNGGRPLSQEEIKDMEREADEGNGINPSQ